MAETNAEHGRRPVKQSTNGRVGGTGRAALVRMGAVLLRLPRYLQLTYRLVRDQRLTAAQRALAAAGAAYAVSPIDPVPGFIPIFGQLDDLAVLLLSLRRVLRRCPDDLAQEHLEAVGLSLAQIDSDLKVVRATAIWTAVNLGRLAGNGLQLAGRSGVRSARGTLSDLLSRRRG